MHVIQTSVHVKHVNVRMKIMSNSVQLSLHKLRFNISLLAATFSSAELLQIVWTQIRTNRTPFQIWIQSVCDIALTPF